MGPLQRFERRLEGLVSGAFARAFRSEVKPVEIAAALQRELDSTAQVLSRQRALVPNVFSVELGPADSQRLAPHAATLVRELATVVREHAQDQSYAFSGPVSVTLDEHDDLEVGQFRIRSEVRAGVDRGAGYDPTDTAETRAAGYLEVNGTLHPVLPPGLVVGRSTECDLRIDDSGVSRRHAEIRVAGSGPDAPLSIVDLGSTNGTVVDGVVRQEADLVEGSRIVLGSTVLTVHRRRRSEWPGV